MNKITDTEIIKALECCIKLNAEPNNFEICKKDCPYKFNCCDREKGTSIEKDILDLINRQRKQLDNYSHNVKNMSKDFIKQQKLIFQQQEEIKKLKAESATAEDVYKVLKEMFKRNE